MIGLASTRIRIEAGGPTLQLLSTTPSAWLLQRSTKRRSTTGTMPEQRDKICLGLADREIREVFVDSLGWGCLPTTIAGGAVYQCRTACRKLAGDDEAADATRWRGWFSRHLHTTTPMFRSPHTTHRILPTIAMALHSPREGHAMRPCPPLAAALRLHGCMASMGDRSLPASLPNRTTTFPLHLSASASSPPT